MINDFIKEINSLKQELFEIKKLLREKNNGITPKATTDTLETFRTI